MLLIGLDESMSSRNYEPTMEAIVCAVKIFDLSVQIALLE